MSTTEQTASMARRALLTEGEREALTDPESRDNPYVAVSRVRKKIQEELPRDVEILKEHNPGLLDELREVVCEDENGEDIAKEDSSIEEPVETRTPEPEPMTEQSVDVEFLVTTDDVPSSGKEAEARREAAVASLALLQEYGEADSSSLKEAAWEAYLATHGVGSEDELGDVPLDTYASASEPERSLWNNSVLPVLRESEYVAKSSDGERRGGYQWETE